MSKFLKIGIYSIWGIFLFLASMEKFGDLFAVGTGFLSVVMLIAAGLCQLLACIIAIGWAVIGTGMLKTKYLSYKFVNNYTVPVLIIGLAIVASTARSSSDEVRALKLGFKDGKEFATARENNITNTADYAKFVEEQRIKAAEKAAQDAALAAEKERQAKRKKLNVSMMLIAMPPNINAEITYVKLLLKNQLSTSLNGLMELLNQNSRHIPGTTKAGN
ncbi:hypothetical protein ACVZDL_18720 [Escherichia coli]